jgi:hypothetical protein
MVLPASLFIHSLTVSLLMLSAVTPGTTRGILAAWCWDRLSELLGLRCKMFVIRMVCLQCLKIVCMGFRVRGRVPVAKRSIEALISRGRVMGGRAGVGDDVGPISRTAASSPAACSVLDGTSPWRNAQLCGWP